MTLSTPRKAATLLLTVLSACADRVTAPVSSPEPAAPPQVRITRESRPFNGAFGTLTLLNWTSIPGGCPDEREFRARGYDSYGNERIARSIYAKPDANSYQCLGEGGYIFTHEVAALLDFQPRRDTREFVNVEMYQIRGGLLPDIRIVSLLWFASEFTQTPDGLYGRSMKSSDVEPDNTREWAIQIDGPWWPSYPVTGASFDRSSVDFRAGEILTVSTRASGTDVWGQAIEIFNQAASNWQSSDPGIVTAASPQTVYSQFGPGWTYSGNRLAARLAGTATVTTTVAGFNLTLPVTVRPNSTISGPGDLAAGTSATYTSTTSGCNTLCTYQWYQRWIDANTGASRTRTLGTGTSQVVSSVNAPFFELELKTTSNGITGFTSTTVNVTGRSGGCTQSIC